MSAPTDAKPLAVVVDDEPEFGALVATWLRRAGFEVLQCRHGWDGINAVRARKPDLIVTDIVMPQGLDGWDMAYLLGATGNSTPVILMTAFSRKVVEKNRRLPGNVVGFLTKPFRESDLQALASTCLQGSREKPGP